MSYSKITHFERNINLPILKKILNYFWRTIFMIFPSVWRLVAMVKRFVYLNSQTSYKEHQGKGGGTELEEFYLGVGHRNFASHLGGV